MSHFDLSRDRIMRKRTPNKRDRKQRTREQQPPPPQRPQQLPSAEDDDVRVDSNAYMLELQKYLNKRRDSKWKSRSDKDYEVGMVMKISDLIENYGWKWWEERQDLEQDDFLMNLIELYQLLVSVYIKNKINIPNIEARPITLNLDILLEMMSNVLNSDLTKLFSTTLGIFKEYNTNPVDLNTASLTFHHIQSLSGYKTGDYSPNNYIDNDVELLKEMDNYADSFELSRKVYQFYNIPEDERIIIKM